MVFFLQSAAQNYFANICSRRSGSKPIMISSPTMIVGVERLWYLPTKSRTAVGSQLTSLT
jgi:hypothetical protein